MILAWLLLLTGLTISSVAIYYSVVGLTAIFSAAAIPIMIMGVSLEVAKLVCATWIKQHWTRVPVLMKTYMIVAVTVLMLITSMGIFGFLSKAHNDQNLVSGDVQSKIAIYDEKIKTERENIDANRKILKQLDESVDQVMGRSQDEKGAEKAVAIRRAQQKERGRIAQDIAESQKRIAGLNEERAPIAAEVRKVEAEVGPIKYIAKFIYGEHGADENMLEKAVTWIIILIVIVFDPLAVIMLLAAQMTFGWKREQPVVEDEWEKQRNELINNPRPVDTKQDNIEPINFMEKFRQRITDRFATAKQVEETSAVITEPTVEEPVMTNHAYLNTGKSFWDKPEGYGSVPIQVYTPEDDQAAMAIVPPDETDLRPFTPEEIAALDQLPTETQPTIEPEAIPGRNRGVMNVHLLAEADNGPELGKPSNTNFGTEFPTNPERGDVYLRVDNLPNRLYKFNGNKWIEVDRSHIDVYAYDELYIKHLIDQIEQGQYDPETLTDLEREQIAEYIKKNA